MKTAILIIMAIAFIGLGISQTIARKPFNPKEPGDEWVEVRKAKRATKAEVARANEIENARLQIALAKRSVRQIEKQRSQRKTLAKQQSRQLSTLSKHVKSLKSQLAKSEKKLVESQKEVASLQAALKHKAWKRSHWIGISFFLIALAFFAGLASSIFLRRSKPESIVLQQVPPAPPPPTKEPSPSSFAAWVDSYVPPKKEDTAQAQNPQHVAPAPQKATEPGHPATS